jgi:hypothetical protein
VTYYLLKTAVGNSAISKFGKYFQWRSEFFKPRMLFLSLGNGAIKAPRYCKLRHDACQYLTMFSGSYSAMNFLAALAIRIQIANSCTRWREIFEVF